MPAGEYNNSLRLEKRSESSTLRPRLQWLPSSSGPPGRGGLDCRWKPLLRGSRFRWRLGLDPAVHALLQEVERQRSAVQDFVVERFDVEARSELSSRLGRSSRRPCKVRQVTSTRAPSSGR